jgi:hypothetical protein
METRMEVADSQCDHKIDKKLPSFWEKWPKQSLRQKRQNTNIKAQLESPKHLHQTTFETFEYLQQNIFRGKCKKCLSEK